MDSIRKDRLTHIQTVKKVVNKLEKNQKLSKRKMGNKSNQDQHKDKE